MRYWVVACLGWWTLAGCSSSSDIAKSVHALREDDFEEHEETTVDGEVMCTAGMFSGESLTTVNQGEVLLIEATGALDTPQGPQTADGADALGGTSYCLINRSVFGLYGQINENTFLIGQRTAMLAPSGGPLTLAINGCGDGCGTSGTFTATIHSNLVDGVTIATEPLLSDDSVLASNSVTVSPGAGWAPSGVDLSRGQKVFVTATGTIRAGGQSYDANGDAGFGGIDTFLVNRHLYRLYGRVGTRVIQLGASDVFLSPDDGVLELAINDRGDAAGSFTVTLDQGVVPATGVADAFTAGATMSETTTVTPSGSGEWQTSLIALGKGMPLLVEASGEVNGPGGSSGPFGDAAIGGLDYPLVNRPINALFGRVGGQTFLLGAENALLAPAAGTLELLINSCAGCVSGSFTATIHTLTGGTPGPDAGPTPDAAAPPDASPDRDGAP
jgi:hypothetical protein